MTLEIIKLLRLKLKLYTQTVHYKTNVIKRPVRVITIIIHRYF